MVVFVSDHGEFLGDHARYDKFGAEAASVNIPLAIRPPGGANRALRHGGLVELTDLTSTLLAAAGLEPGEALGGQKRSPFHDRVPGRSLLSIVRGESETAVRDDAFSEFSGVWTSIETERWKYVREQSGLASARERLFDLGVDPEELHNRAEDAACAPVLNDFRNRLLARLDWCAAGQYRLEDFAPVA